MRILDSRGFRLISAAVLVALLLLKGCAQRERDKDMQGCSFVISVYDAETDRVTDMELEEYIACVVAAEMPASFEIEALKAQAVAARTYALRRIGRLGGEPCGRLGADICTESTCCQSFEAIEDKLEEWGEDGSAYAKKLRDAALSTAGLVLMYEGEPIEALYHACSGGVTEASADVFGAELPYLVSVESPGEETADRYRDSFTFSRTEFAKKLNAAFPDAGLEAAALEGQIGEPERSEGGRVTELSLGDETVTGRMFRKALDLPSAAFELIFDADSVTVLTRGYGHGVGMSQYGAQAMAKNKKDYRAILEHYYPGTEVKDMISSFERVITEVCEDE